MYGRIVRTTRDTPLRLADSDRRRFVMITGPSGLRRIQKRDGWTAMVELGHTPEAIARELAHGMRFHLVTFARPQRMHHANWQGVINAAVEHYPEFEDALRAALPELRRKPLAEFEAEMGAGQFSLIHARKTADEHFLTPARFAASKRTAADVRLFLFNELHLNELFTGDGRTLTHTGLQGVREYVTPNVDIASLRNVTVTPIVVGQP